MIAALQGRVALLLTGLALLAAAIGCFLLILNRIDTMLERARTTAIESRDAYWSAEIERGNALANSKIAEQAKAALAIETNANARIRAAETQIANLEDANAALPDGDACGLRRDRVGVLPR